MDPLNGYFDNLKIRLAIHGY